VARVHLVFYLELFETSRFPANFQTPGWLGAAITAAGYPERSTDSGLGFGGIRSSYRSARTWGGHGRGPFCCGSHGATAHPVANLRSSQKSNGLAGERPNYNTPRIPSMTPPHPSLSLMWVAFAVGGVAFRCGSVAFDL